jgi:hypothetical protein
MFQITKLNSIFWIEMINEYQVRTCLKILQNHEVFNFKIVIYKTIKRTNFVYLIMVKKSLYTRKLGRAVAKNAQPVSSGRYHVISGEAKKWAVVPEGSVHAVKAFSTKKDAVTYAKRSALKKTGEVIIHERTGQIRDRISFAKK